MSVTPIGFLCGIVDGKSTILHTARGLPQKVSILALFGAETPFLGGDLGTKSPKPRHEKTLCLFRILTRSHGSPVEQPPQAAGDLVPQGDGLNRHLGDFLPMDWVGRTKGP